jgi:DNA-binding transcriptional ArsR family regulator
VEVTAAHAREAEACRVVCVNGERVARARAAAPDDESFQRAADRFSALSDPTRLRILHALSRAELCVCDLANVTARSMPATSHQLKLLRNLGLVRFRTAGKLAYYSLADERVRSLLEEALPGRGGARP